MDRLLTLTLLNSIHYSLNVSLSKRVGRPNFEVDFPPKEATKSAHKKKKTLLSTFEPKATIVGNVTGPFLLEFFLIKFWMGRNSHNNLIF